MSLGRIAFSVLIAVSAARLSEAQPPKERIPQGIEALRESASSKTSFTLDHSMLVFASKLEPDNGDLRRVIAGVSGLSFRSYHFSGPWRCDKKTLSSVKNEYHAAGWKQLMDNHEDSGGSEVTDLWVQLENNAISNVAFLITRANEVKFIVVSGSMSPVDLSHLGGHFGIPKIEGGVMVPNTTRRP
jgi:hypothetical protein